MMRTALIAVDWGTTSFRAFALSGTLCGEETIIVRTQAPAGIMQVADGAFETVLEEQLQRLDASADVPVIMSGMITSRQGWIEVDYLPCPAGGDEIASALHRHETRTGRTVHLVAGLIDRREPARPDVMRGEETQILGAVDETGDRSLAVLPGTHSKWAEVERGRILRFSTYMTGELFAVLRQHSILGRLMEGDNEDEAGFEAGVRVGLASEGGLLRDLFSVRTLPLTGALAAGATASYLSGLLIGAEIASARAVHRGLDAPVMLIGSDRLVARYGQALALASIRSERARDDAAAWGMLRIARSCGIVGS